MAFSYTTYTGNGSATQYAVAFGYIRREHVAVTVAGLASTFTWVNNSLIQMDAAPAAAAAVRVYRTTPISAPLVDFADGSTLVAADLDTNSRQSIYIQQELNDAQVDNLADLIPNGNKGDITTSASGAVWAINNGAVTEVKLAANAVTSGKIADDTIVNADVNASAGITADKLAFTQTGTGAVARTVESKLKDTVSRKDFGTDGNFTAAGTSPSAQLNQIDFYQAGSSGHQILPSDRGLVHKATQVNTLSSWNAAPNGTPAGTNTAYSVLRAWGQDIITNPTSTRQCLELDTHYDTDALLRGRFCTRSEGSPAVSHFDVYHQYNGTNCAYFGTKRDGATGSVNLGFNARGFVFDTTATVLWAATSAITLGIKRLVTRSQHLYLECTTAGTTGSTEPIPGQAGTTVSDGSVTWTVRSKLGSTPPGIWLDQNGNIGFNTLSPTYGVHIAGAEVYCEQGVRFLNNKISNIIKTSASIAFGTIAAGTHVTNDLTVAGATVGQTVVLGIPWQLDQDGIMFQAVIRSANLVRLGAHNYSTTSKTLAAQTFDVTLISTDV